MPIGQILQIPSGSAQIVRTQAMEESQAFALLNPNDGVCYIKINGAASLTSAGWDWKLPSQSYGVFPGPWLSLGVYYLDQSGSGRTGEMNLYDASVKIVIPIINSIGRAVQVSGSVMDITQGTQPSNPPLGVSRLWVDANGNLYILSPTGTQVHAIDTDDALGGVLAGTLPNPVLATRAQSNFSNASGAQSGRVHFQTNEANQGTNLGLAPNGSSPSSQFIANSNSDVMNASRLRLSIDNTQALVASDALGTGSIQPLIFNSPNGIYLQSTSGAKIDSSNQDFICNSGALIAGNGFVFVGSQKDVYLKRTGASALEIDGVISLVGGLAPNTIKTADIQVGAAEQQLGNYYASPTWSTTVAGSWVATPVSVNVNIQSASDWIRIEYAIPLKDSAASVLVQVGLGWAGILQQAIHDTWLAAANWPTTAAGTHYVQLPAGAQQLTLWINSFMAGTVTLDTSHPCRMFVTEQKR